MQEYDDVDILIPDLLEFGHVGGSRDDLVVEVRSLENGLVYVYWGRTEHTGHFGCLTIARADLPRLLDMVSYYEWRDGMDWLDLTMETSHGTT